MVAPETAQSAPARSLRARACWVKCGPVIEGRGALRVPFDETVVVTPWDVAKGAPAGASILAAGRDLSTTGLSFSHTAALAARYVAVSFRGDRIGDDRRPEIDTMLVRLIWCRFTRRGIYLSGGRLEGTIRDGFGEALGTLFGSF